MITMMHRANIKEKGWSTLPRRWQVHNHLDIGDDDGGGGGDDDDDGGDDDG